jgi:hypothetical protein
VARPQAAHRPPRKDYVEVDVAAGTGDDVAKVLLTSERETPRSHRPSPWPALTSPGRTPFVTSHSHCPSRCNAISSRLPLGRWRQWPGCLTPNKPRS